MDGLARTIDVVNPHLTLEGLRIACARARRARPRGPVAASRRLDTRRRGLLYFPNI